MFRSGLFAVIVAAFCIPISAQQSIWTNVPADWETFNRGTETAPSASQEQSVVKLLKSLPPPWNCAEDSTGEWLKLLRYRSLSLLSKSDVFLVEAGSGCASGNANHAMWLIRFDKNRPILLAGREQAFDGYLYAVLKSTSKGYRDIVLGWRRRLGESALVYFRFDGKVYRPLGGATHYEDEKGLRIIPNNPKPYPPLKTPAMNN